MTLNSAIGVNCEGLVAITTADKVVSIFQFNWSSPLATCQLPAPLGAVKRLNWANSQACWPTHMLSADCEKGYAVLDLVKSNFVELRLRHACPLPSLPRSHWLDLENEPAALAVSLQMPRCLFIWSSQDLVASFTLLRCEPRPSILDGHYLIHWKRLPFAKDMVTIWPTMLSCELQVDAPVLMTCSTHSPLFAYSDSLSAGLYLGAIHNPSLVVLPDVFPIKLDWLQGGYLLCLLGPTPRKPHRRLVMYDEALTELFSFSDVVLGSQICVNRLEVDASTNATYKTAWGAESHDLLVFDEWADYVVSGCGRFIAVRSSYAVSLWEAAGTCAPKLLRVFDYSILPGFRIFWAKFSVPWLFMCCSKTPYLGIYRGDCDPKIVEVESRNPISDIVVTREEDLIVCSTDSYQYIGAGDLWPAYRKSGNAYDHHAPQDQSTPARCSAPIEYDWLSEAAEAVAAAGLPSLKRSYAAMADQSGFSFI